MPVQANAHPDRIVHPGENSDIHHPPPTEGPKPEKEVPDTGWRGPIPSEQGGTEEKDYMNKPPYNWKSKDDKFVPKYERSILCSRTSACAWY